MEKGGLSPDAANLKGAFSVSDGSMGFASAEWKQKCLLFNASKSNAIFGKSSTVQPASAQVLIIIKV